MLSCTSPKLKVINNLCNHKTLSDKMCVNMHNRRIHVITGVNYVRLQYLPIHVLLKYFVITFISSSLHDASNNCLPYVCMVYVITHVSNKISMQ